MGKGKILIVEDEQDISEMVTYNLNKEGYDTISAVDGEKAIDLATRKLPDLVVLDLMLPNIDGLDVCKILKQDATTKQIPIIILSAKSQVEDKIVGLELGADDYMTKPFSPKELIARIKSVLRRERIEKAEKRIIAGNLSIDIIKHKASISDKEITLTPTEFKLLVFMAERPGEVLSREKLLDHVFGYDSSSYDRTVDTHIKSLRKKLRKLKDLIETVRGTGYRFKELMI
jgi:two-component system, OmpR family, alkaline phosphatase synthesis response regulator PhoP